MDDTEKQVDTLPKEQPQPAESKETPTTKTYTQEDINRLTAKGAELGRKYKTLETEHRTLREQNITLSSELDGLKAAAKEIEDAGGDAAKLQARIKELATKESTLKAREATLSERERIVQEVELSTNATIIASQYNENDPERLIKLCKRAGIKADDEDGIKEIASDMGWTPLKEKEPEKEPETTVTAVSGVTHGGSGKMKTSEIAKMTPKEIGEILTQNKASSILELIEKGVIADK